ncbi:MAG TPA: DUF2723 domain-containing protein [Polyangiales bacterium]
MELTTPQQRPRTGLSTLYLPLYERSAVWFAVLALSAVYAASMARDLSLYDSGELALAAVRLGLGHPPGQPLHTLLGFVAAHLPGVPALVGVNLVSALPGALTVLPAASLAQTLLPARPPTVVSRALPWLLACGALHPSLWEPATRVEVYSLSTFFAVWALARLAAIGDGEPGSRHALAHIFQAGLALGLCASVNPMIALCTGVSVAPLILWRIVQRRSPLCSLAYAVCGGVLGLLPYLYLFAVARRTDVMVWGTPRTAQSLWLYVTLNDYVQNQQVTGATWFAHIVAWFRWAAVHQLAPLIVIGWAGHLRFGARGELGRAAGPLLLTLLVAAFSSASVWNLDIPDYNGYVATGLWLAFAAVPAFCVNAWLEQRRLVALVLAASLVVSAVLAPPAVLARTRQHDHLARSLAGRVFVEAPAHAIVIVEADHLVGALFYLQEAELARPDLVVLAYGLGNSSWHWERMAHLHPELAPFALRGPGGKRARVRRFLAANAARPLLVEHLSLAAELGLRACPGGLLLRTGAACDAPSAPDPALPALLSRSLTQLGSGSPGADEAIAKTAFTAGESLWRLGYPRAALQALLSGVPQRMQPRGLRADSLAERGSALQSPMPVWQRPVPLGDPARNLFVAAGLLQSAQLSIEAAACLQSAAADGLPEALESSPAR